MDKLTPSLQHYVKAIYELSSQNAGVRISDIATKLHIRKSSVCVAMKTLEDTGIVCRDGERLVYLTDWGEVQAVACFDKYHILYSFLINVLHLDEKTAAADACSLEHAVSIKTLCALCRLNNQSGKLLPKGGCHVIDNTGSGHAKGSCIQKNNENEVIKE